MSKKTEFYRKKIVKLQKTANLQQKHFTVYFCRWNILGYFSKISLLHFIFTAEN